MESDTKVVVIVQLWEQAEEEVKTADAGYSLHPHEEDRKDFIEGYLKSLPDEPPRVYARPVQGAVYQAYVNIATYHEVCTEKFGKRYEDDPPRNLVQ